ncbi:4-(cytidine 5'-diphospho)-2-C-methyl-D-erythritol kinase [Romboutsia sp. 1001216sp1]|uniref:4-(cytidine 5'-diphospho)-2-C-methyl-D-erythritol kinase n=1 Tax=Romboutsia sp. 1001216sp1 TaxID=2986997 RepID=UPI00232FF194|nr:4-(cytidine 5'-diphospho)-2-C-methyl-D-erythritol kinase [Romboutsia sp. 1001216sp1]MDB8805817.1 4-(cytidine 5'-diphospho)-2-C-methyl-D-erythritol kinase [Romboutsia sp. 1001216sp1]MDB8808847.1 4-(cytidine 5'-diphospho)-2-C-methyl-D-erythritol kinase [Romboutsia sp. 1001216sp1]MDB8811570.1 4-(cytidine 5'-diphospho)-2-C-methyl-D-erythritol kinase [Romboutsia sp. 1001216sp1]MDB8817171.1 4-(cytidine 5'-diphospho)-2-C-methyl-D-erythritol kinase [Romboutsia sp. 1001216sp1]MDB8819770.1 4-(cytidin
MNSIELKSRAKINLSIDVLGKRDDGYHLVEMIMQTIDLYDVIKIKQLDTNDVVIKSNSSHIPLDNDNIVYKAIELLRQRFNINKGIEVFIEKNIPVAAGMAGGSSNAAAILVGLNKLWKLNLTEQELQELGLKLGADVPYCISGKTALAEGIGEKLSYIKGLPKNISILICKPNLFVSTKDVYQGLDLNNIENRPNNKLLIECLEKGDIDSLSKNMSNVLENVTSKIHKEINEIEEIMMANSALGSMMSGSGPTVFGLFDKSENALKCKDILLQQYSQVYVVSSSEKGVEICG